GLVLSSLIKVSPALTASPSATRISLMIPPSRCWIVFRLDSASTVPNAIAALSRGAKVDHVPKPRINPKSSKLPVQATPRSLANGPSDAGAEHQENVRTSAWSDKGFMRVDLRSKP